MAYHLLPCDREQNFLLSISLKDWLPQAGRTGACVGVT